MMNDTKPPQDLARVSAMYMGLLPKLWSNLKRLTSSSLSSEARRDLFATSLSLVKNVPATFFLEYLRDFDEFLALSAAEEARKKEQERLAQEARELEAKLKAEAEKKKKKKKKSTLR
eukprot:TRINITY_DN39938_c0_g1_i1.p2 TRINITY_DN39938_c0_g1~~TRINITY_DN39938_c0_g1_i1.p2  ORF type:complete len:117 (+),score=52.73 TRINITY_DN39938_c0_g1_i1:101-451(+)